MDIKLKKNKNNSDMNYSENDVNAMKKKVYKSKGIIATLVSLLIIASAALGMCKAYPIIDKSARNIENNYFEHYGFAEDLAETSYVNYFSTLSEKNEGNLSPGKTLLNLESNIYSNENYYTGEEYINQFNSNFNNWRNRTEGRYTNLLYYAYNKTNNVDKTNMGNGVEVKDKNVVISQDAKDIYQFYVALNFDENGIMTITDIYGADKNNFEYNLIDNLDGIDDYYEYTIKPIKNMSIVYAVPKVLPFDDVISWGINNSKMVGYEMAGATAVTVIITFIAIAALIFPINKAKNMSLFNGLSKIPFEVWMIICGLDIALLMVSPRYMVKPALEGNLEYLFGFIINGFTVSQNLIWFFNFITWVIEFGVAFFAVLIIKYIFNMGFKEYFKKRTILGRILTLIIRYVKKVLNEVTKVDLSEKNNKLIIKLLLINAVILLIITSIWFFGIPVVILYSIILFFVIRKYVDKISEKYSKLREATSKIAQGNLDVKIEEDLGLFEPFKMDLEKIQGGFKKAVDEEVKSQKMKTDLISNVSHDLKTPLTAIITYADLLKDENLSQEKRRQYIETLDKKAQRLQVLIEDLFEMSKATSGNITLNIENIDVASLMKQTLLELEDKLEEANLSVRKNIPEGKVILPLDSQRTFRIFENLVINMTKYAMPNTRVFIDMIEDENKVEIIMKNMAAEEITFNVETIAERFVRGDESRNTEGSGLGLAIAKSFVELQGGKFDISVDGDLFKVTIIFTK